MDDIVSRPLVHALMQSPMSGQEIEAASFAAIDREAPLHDYDSDTWEVVRRMIHTTADFGVIGRVRFSPDAISAGIRALSRGSPIYMDSNMIRSGISLPRLRRVCTGYDAGKLHCHVADSDVVRQAQENHLPRALFAVRKAKHTIDGGIAMFGNSPVGLLELNRLVIEENIKPCLVIGMPVGFVHVEESKQELMDLDVPWIALLERRGGSPLAVSAIHAIATLASRKET